MMARRGISLLEVLVAMFILALTISLLAASFPLGKRASRRSDKLAVAVFLAQGEMERLLNTPPSQWKLQQNQKIQFDPPYDNYQYLVETLNSPVNNTELTLLRVSIYEVNRKHPIYFLETLAFL